jgi:fatty-acyl-CoA synthase
MIGLDPPSRALRIYRALDRLGQLGAAIAIAAIRHGDRVGVLDERGAVSLAELDARSDALACALRDRGMREGDGVGVLCRNHRGFIDITFGAAKVGARVLYLNTDFAGPQLRDVCRREDVSLLVHDEEYNQLVEPIEARHGRLLGWTDGEPPADSLEAAIAAFAGHTPPPPGTVAGSDRRAALEGPLPRAGIDLRRGATVPRARVHPDGPLGHARLHDDPPAAFPARAGT